MQACSRGADPLLLDPPLFSGDDGVAGNGKVVEVAGVGGPGMEGESVGRKGGMALAGGRAGLLETDLALSRAGATEARMRR